MKSMGLRAEPEKFWWVIVSGTTKSPVLEGVNKVRKPKTFSEPQMLSHFRERLLSLISEHRPDIITLKRPEIYGRGNKNVGSMDCRLRTEGVLLEAANSIGLTAEAMLWTQVSRGMDSDSAKDYVKKGGEVRGVTLPIKDANAREALLAALAGLR